MLKRTRGRQELSSLKCDIEYDDKMEDDDENYDEDNDDKIAVEANSALKFCCWE